MYATGGGTSAAKVYWPRTPVAARARRPPHPSPFELSFWVRLASKEGTWSTGALADLAADLVSGGHVDSTREALEEVSRLTIRIGRGAVNCPGSDVLSGGTRGRGLIVRFSYK